MPTVRMPVPFVRPPWATPSSLWRQLVALPVEEPLTLGDGLLYAGFAWADGDPRETLMRGFISAARQKVEHDTGLALLTQSWDLFIEPTVSASGLYVLPLLPPQAQPLQSIVAVAALDDAGGMTHVPLAAVESIPHDARLRVSWPHAAGAFVVRIVSGWTTAAQLALEAPLLRHAVGLMAAHYATTGRDAVLAGTIGQPMPFGYDDAINPYRRVWLV